MMYKIKQFVWSDETGANNYTHIKMYRYAVGGEYQDIYCHLEWASHPAHK